MENFLLKLFNFKGKIGRLEFFLTTLITVLVYLFIVGETYGENGIENETAALFCIILIPISCWILWAAAAKRFRDTGVSPWWSLLMLIPTSKQTLLVLVYLYLCFRESKKTEDVCPNKIDNNTNNNTTNLNTPLKIPSLKKQNADNTIGIAICSITIIFITTIIALIIIKG